MTPWENGGIIIVAVIVTSDIYIYTHKLTCNIIIVSWLFFNEWVNNGI